MPIAAATTTTPHASSTRAPRRAISLPKRLAIHHCPRSSLPPRCILARLKYVLYQNDFTSWRRYPSRLVGLSSMVVQHAILKASDALAPLPQREGLGRGQCQASITQTEEHFYGIRGPPQRVYAAGT